MAIERSRPADPVRNMKYQVRVEGFQSAGFHKCSGLKETSDVIEYREGTDPLTPRKLMGMVKYDDIVLEKGLANNQDFKSWREEVFSVIQSGNLIGDTSISDSQVRRDMEIQVVDMHGLYSWYFNVFNAWPKSYEIGEMDAMGNGVLIEKMEITHEGWTRGVASGF